MRTLLLMGLAAALALASSRSAEANQVVLPPTLRELVQEEAQEDDCVVVAESVDGTERSRFRIVRIIRGENCAAVGDHFQPVSADNPKKGKRYLLVGVRQRKEDTRVWSQWWSPPLSDSVIEFIATLPAPNTPDAERLKHFAAFLGSDDPTIEAEVLVQFNSARWRDLVAISNSLPCDKLRELVASGDDETKIHGQLLGLCGNKKDAAMMKARILQEPREMRPGIEGVMCGYLLLTGEEGLAVLDEAKLKPNYVVSVRPDGKIMRENKVLFGETYAAMQAIRFMWDHGDGKIGQERLRQSMRLLLDRPDLADLVIADLTRWKDWSVQDRLLAMYGTAEYDHGTIKRAIIRYCLTCARDIPPAATEEPPHVTKAKEHLETLRKRDPKLVAEVERSM